MKTQDTMQRGKALKKELECLAMKNIVPEITIYICTG